MEDEAIANACRAWHKRGDGMTAARKVSAKERDRIVRAAMQWYRDYDNGTDNGQQRNVRALIALEKACAAATRKRRAA